MNRSRLRRIALGGVGGIILAALAVAGLRQLARSRTFQLFGEIVHRVDTRDSVVALSFDDGPIASVADTLIAMLGARGVHATFFVTGNELAAAPSVGAALVAAGHELGNHTWSHRRMVLVSPATVRQEVERTDSVIRAAGERGPIRFRPPFGYKLFGLPWHLWRTDRTTVTWDVEPDSYARVAATSDGIVAHVIERVRPGSIILLHPWYRSRATSLAAIPVLVDSLHARGYRVTTVGELLGETGTPSPEALLSRAIEVTGGATALERARALRWDGDAVVEAGGRTVNISGSWAVQPPDTAIVATYDAARGPASARTLIVAAPRGWLVSGDRFEPMPPPMLANERDQFYLYDVMRLVPLREPGVRLSALPADDRGESGFRAERDGRPTVDLYFEMSGRLSRISTAVQDPAGGPSARQDLRLSGTIEADGVRWPSEIRITLNDAPYFTLKLRSLRIEPRIDDARLSGPP